jgi:thiol-disulfide isomerase/thioredoxin
VAYFRSIPHAVPAVSLLFGLALAPSLRAQEPPASSQKSKPADSAPKSSKTTEAQAAALEQSELQKAISDAENDRAALARNLESFLKKYPESKQRPQIYRALIEADLQLREFPRATEYAERLVALSPNDSSINVLAIQLLERYGDAAGWRRAISYCSRVLESIALLDAADKSPKVSAQDWNNERKRDRAALLLVRGRLYQKLNDLPNAQMNFDESYRLNPTSQGAEGLGELAEMRKDFPTAIQQYARAFALSRGTTGEPSRKDLRKKLGNAWRLAHGSEGGLGDYLLHSFDETMAATSPVATKRNEGRQDFYEFVLRKAPDGSANLPMADAKGKIVVLNFWATWCGPCREMEPHFEKLANQYAGQKEILFYALNCDEDETQVAPFLEEEKPKTAVLYADGLDRLLGVDSFPTTVILDRSGKIAYRTNGFDPDSVEKELGDAIERALRPQDLAQSSNAKLK